MANMAPQGFLSMPVQQAAAAQQLGNFNKSYNTNFVSSIIGIVVCAAAGLLFVSFAFGGDDGAAFQLVIAFLLFAVTAYLIYRLAQFGGRKIHLFQRGLIIESGNQIQPFPWNQTAEVWQQIIRRYRYGIYVGSSYKYTLRRTDGYQVKLDNMVKGIAELGEAVSNGVTQELVPRALHSIRNGQTLTFGQFIINQQGIGNGREFIPWPEVQAVNVNRGRLTVQKAGKFFSWGSSMVARIPNFFVFLAVAEEMIRQAASSGMRRY